MSGYGLRQTRLRREWPKYGLWLWVQDTANEHRYETFTKNLLQKNGMDTLTQIIIAVNHQMQWKQATVVP